MRRATPTSFRHPSELRCRLAGLRVLAGLTLSLAVSSLAQPVMAQAVGWSGHVRAAWLDGQRQDLSPMAQAVRWQPALGDAWGRAEPMVHAEIKGEHAGWTARAHAQAGRRDAHAAVDELFASTDWAAWQLSAGRKLVAWDVGYAWRPNDVVAREPRRPLLGVGSPGRPLLQAEWFGAETALSLVWVNPMPRTGAQGADEQAVAGRLYWRQGGTDWHAFARHGQRSLGSVGLAFSAVPSDAWELHGSWRWQSPSLQQGAYHQVLVGGTWTHSSHLSLLIEAWRDGAARSPGRWQAWQQSVAQLQAGQGQPLPGSPQAGAMAGKWMGLMQAFNEENLRRQNLLLRLSWDQSPWALSLDALLHPEDRGHSLGLNLAWQGDRWRLEASWRRFGGPGNSAMAQLPLKQQAQLSAIWNF